MMIGTRGGFQSDSRRGERVTWPVGELVGSRRGRICLRDMSDVTPPPLPDMPPTPLTYEPVVVAPRPRVWRVFLAFAMGLAGAVGVMAHR